MKMGLDQQLPLAAEPVESSIRNYSEMLINYFYLEVLITKDWNKDLPYTRVISVLLPIR